jgi:hypothetical protein
VNVELSWIVVKLLPSRDLTWRRGEDRVRLNAPHVGWRGLCCGGLELVFSGSVGEERGGVGGSGSAVAGSVIGSHGVAVGVWG